MKREEYFRRLDLAIRYIEDNLQENLSMQDISKKAFSSLSHFHRIFGGMTGMSLKQYIRRRRLTGAAKMLINSQMKIIDIALMTQFESHESFSRAFKKQFGKSPIEFRQNPGSYTIQSLINVFRDYATTPQIPDYISVVDVMIEGVKIAGISINTTMENNQQAHDIPNFVMTSYTQDVFLKCQKAESYGVYTNMTDEEDFTFLFGKKSECLQAKGLETVDIPAGLYARFSVVGGPSQIGKAWSYIYGAWMPNSGRARRNGFDFEMYFPDKTDIYIPIFEDDTKYQEESPSKV